MQSRGCLRVICVFRFPWILETLFTRYSALALSVRTQAEVIASKIPLRLPFFEAAWLHGRGMFRDISADSSGSQGRLDKILITDIRDPATCSLTDPSDASKLKPLLEFAAKEIEVCPVRASCCGCAVQRRCTHVLSNFVYALITFLETRLQCVCEDFAAPRV